MTDSKKVDMLVVENWNSCLNCWRRRNDIVFNEELK